MDRTLGNNNYDLWRTGFILELLSAYLSLDTTDLKISVFPYADTATQTYLTDFIPAMTLPITQNECRKMTESIEDAITGKNRPTDTFVARCLELLVSKVRAGRPTTVITLSGSVSNGKFDSSPSSIPNRMANAIKNIASKVGPSSTVKFFAAGYVGANFDEEEKANYNIEINALSDKNSRRGFINKDQIELFKELVRRLRHDGVLCDKQGKSKNYSNNKKQ